MSLYKIDNININNDKKDYDIIKGINITQPLFKLGYNYEINELRNKYNKIKENEYQIIIKNNINELTKKYLNKDLDISIIFNKYWELLVIFKILDETKKEILLINDYTSDIYKSIINFKEKIYNKKNKSDNITIYNINKENDIIFNNYKKIEFINKENKIKDKNEYDIIICNTDLNNDNIDINYKEQYLYELKLFEIITILKNQKKGGISIIKYYDMFTKTSIKLLKIILKYYENVYIYKCKIEDKNTDRYIICINYKGNNKSDIKKIDNLYKEIITDNKTFLLNINDNNDDEDIENNIRKINIEIIMNMINNIRRYIDNVEKNNITEIIYNREELNKEWINKYYPINEEELNLLRNI